MNATEFDKPARELRSWSIAPSGAPYVTLTECGPKDDGEGFRDPPKTTANEAFAAYVDELLKFIPVGASIYWRVKPELMQGDSGWRVYSRLAHNLVTVEKMETDDERKRNIGY